VVSVWCVCVTEWGVCVSTSRVTYKVLYLFHHVSIFFNKANREIIIYTRAASCDVLGNCSQNFNDFASHTNIGIHRNRFKTSLSTK
jgi:hypothetical protein